MIEILLAIISVVPVSVVLIHTTPGFNKKLIVPVLFSIFLGVSSTFILLELHPLIWPDIPSVKTTKNILTQTVHIAFIQAGMMEEFIKILFILIAGKIYSYYNKIWYPSIFLIAGFVAIGFAMAENAHYFKNADADILIQMVIGRTIHSVNIHLLINLCFALFLIKSNYRKDKVIYLGFALFLAVAQHGVVDFLLIPGSRIGGWIATALFVGIWVWVVNDFRKYIPKV